MPVAPASRNFMIQTGSFHGTRQSVILPLIATVWIIVIACPRSTMPCWQSMVTVSQSALAMASALTGELIASQAFTELFPSAQNLISE